MKWRPVLIVLFTIFILILMVLFMMMGMGIGSSSVINDPQKHGLMKVPDTIIAQSSLKFVKTTNVKNQSYLINVNTLGRVNSSQSISVSAEVQGVLRKGSVSLKRGVAFKKGQVLFSINNDDSALMLKARKSGYLNLLANILPDIKIDYAQDYEVWKMFFDMIDINRSLPPMPPLVNNKLKTLLASRNILAEYYNIKADQIKLGKFTIYAPFNGTITDAFADVGSIVNPGAGILNIINNSQLEVECPVSPEEIGLIEIGASVALLDDNRNKWSGSVIRKGQYVNPNTQSIPVFIEIDTKDKSLYNGMYLDAEIKGDSLRNVFEIPRRALLEHSRNIYALEDSALVQMKVDILLSKDETILVGGLDNKTIIVSEPVIIKGTETKYASLK